MSAFKYELGDVVKMTMSDEAGTIIGRAEYSFTNDKFLVRYADGGGRQVEEWWSEDAIEPWTGEPA